MSRLISAVIPTYNYRQYVTEAVESVLGQTYQPVEVIVVDDGSTDGTDDELRRFGTRIRYVRQENRGLPAARNRGIAVAEGQLLAFLDADDLWAPSKLEKQVAMLERSPQLGLVCCAAYRLHVQSGARELFACQPDAWGDIRRQLLYRNRVMGSASAALVRRSCFDRVGLFDEGLRSAEDWDMWIRISRHYHIGYIDEPLVTVRVHGANMHKSIARMHTFQLKVLRRAFEEDTVDGGNQRLLRRGLAHIHFDAGAEYLEAQEYPAALRHLARAIALWPLERVYYLHLARAIVRRPVAGYVVRPTAERRTMGGPASDVPAAAPGGDTPNERTSESLVGTTVSPRDGTAA